MRRNLVLVLIIIIALFLAKNSLSKIMSFRAAEDTVKTEQERLDKLKAENESLKKELAYKSTDQFAEEEIRDKLGMAKQGETVVILPKEQGNSQLTVSSTQSTKPNWLKWRRLFFGG